MRRILFSLASAFELLSARSPFQTGLLTCISAPGQEAELVIEIPLKQGDQQK
jgi:hypothetical protein